MKAAMIRIIQVFIVLLGMSAMGVGIRIAVEVLGGGGQYEGLAGWAIGLAGWASAGVVLLMALITMIGAILVARKIGSKKERRN